MAKFLVTVEKAPQVGCGGLLVLIFIIWAIAKSGSSSSDSSFTYVPPPYIPPPPPQTDEAPVRGSAPGTQLFGDLPKSKQQQLTNLGPGDSPTRQRGALGIHIVDIDEIESPTRAKLGLSDTSGVLVTGLISGGPAEQAGIHKADIILAVNGHRVPTTSELQSVVSAAGIGAIAAVRVQRGGQQLDLLATLGSAGSSLQLGTSTRHALTSADPGDEGSDATRPMLAPDDDGFFDARGGWGWGDRCWNHIQSGKLGWAKAECRKGMSMADPGAQQPRASLLYNLGLIECGGYGGPTHPCPAAPRNADGARRFFEQSLTLREHPDVRAALDSLP